MTIESALIIAVPEAEPLVKALRDQFDWSAAQGVPAHITIDYPFIPPDQITPEVLADLREFFAQFAAFEFTLPETRHFPFGVVSGPLARSTLQDIDTIHRRALSRLSPVWRRIRRCDSALDHRRSAYR